MIYTSSIIDGFKAILGAPPIHVAMIITLLIAIPIPRDDNGTWFDLNDKALAIYSALLAYHTLCLILVTLFILQHRRSQLLISQLSIFALCFFIVVILEVCSQWTFTRKIMGQCFEEQRETIFTLWTIIELLVFLSSIATNIIWLFLRSNK